MGFKEYAKQMVKQSDYEDAKHFKVGFENAGIFRDVTFNFIESVAILSALEVVSTKTNSPVFWSIYAAAYVALFIYMLSFWRYFVNVTNEKFDIFKNKSVFAYVGALSATALSIILVHSLTKITTEFVNVNFMQ